MCHIDEGNPVDNREGYPPMYPPMYPGYIHHHVHHLYTLGTPCTQQYHSCTPAASPQCVKKPWAQETKTAWVGEVKRAWELFSVKNGGNSARC